MTTSHQCQLNDWSFKFPATDTEFTPCLHNRPTAQSLPDLIKSERIPDPFIGINEQTVQHLAEQDCLYKAEFHVGSDILGLSRKDLVFEGIDCFARVYLNPHSLTEPKEDSLLFSNTNSFHVTRINVSERLKEGINELWIVFRSDLQESKRQEKEKGKRAAWNGDPSRVYIRKPQYQFGWDWGPALLCSGITRPIRLEAFDTARLEDIFADLSLDKSLKIAIGKLHFSINAAIEQPTEFHLIFTIKERTELNPQIIFQASHTTTRLTDSIEVKVEHFKRWHPHRFGAQPLYDFSITLYTSDGLCLDQLRKRIGFRKAELIQRPLLNQSGTSFFFQVNDQPLFCCGANWIPAHSFETEITASDYQKWIELARDANMDMLRVWGGGLGYERDEFFDLCDEMGMLIWMDFPFACGQYPGDDLFVESVNREVKDQLRRIRSHACTVLYCGNNEDYQIAEAEKLTEEQFAARKIYEEVLPSLVKLLSPSTSYHPGSPYGGKTSRDPTVGDTHCWDVWHGAQKPYQDYNKLSSRFVSEFGMQSQPHIATTAYFLKDARQSQYHPQSRIVESHNKADSWERRLALYVLDNVRLTTMNLAEWTYLTHLVQAEALTYALRGWRRNWKGKCQELTAGALLWQLNDCWPCASWSIIDCFFRPKLAYYAVKREAATFTVGLYRTTSENRTYVEVWVSSFDQQSRTIFLNIRPFDPNADTVKLEAAVHPISIGPNQSTEIDRVLIKPTEAVFASITMDGDIVASAVDWPQPLKYIHFEERKVTLSHSNQNTITVSANKPIKCLQLFFEAEPDAVFSDNGFDVLPGQSKVVRYKAQSSSRDVKFQYYSEKKQQILSTV